MATMTVKFDLTESELREGNSLQMRLWRRALIFTVIILVTLFAIDAYFYFVRCCAHVDIARKLITHIGEGLGLGVGYYLLLRFILVPRMCRKRFRENPLFYTGLTINLDEDGLRYNGRNTQSAWQWSDLVGYRENDNIFLLCLSKTFAYVVPKRLFPGPDAEKLRQLLDIKLKRL